MTPYGRASESSSPTHSLDVQLSPKSYIVHVIVTQASKHTGGTLWATRLIPDCEFWTHVRTRLGVYQSLSCTDLRQFSTALSYLSSTSEDRACGEKSGPHRQRRHHMFWAFTVLPEVSQTCVEGPVQVSNSRGNHGGPKKNTTAQCQPARPDFRAQSRKFLQGKSGTFNSLFTPVYQSIWCCFGSKPGGNIIHNSKLVLVVSTRSTMSLARVFSCVCSTVRDSDL